MSKTEARQCACKIGRVRNKYDFDNLNEGLLWKRQTDDASLRDLADYLNERVLAEAMDAAQAKIRTEEIFEAVSDEEVVSEIYQTLSDKEDSPGRKARIRTRLRQTGIDIDEIESDWVTHMTVRKHLNTCLDVDTSRGQSISLESGRNTIEWARTRCLQVISHTFARLDNADVIETGSLESSVTVQLTCQECSDTFTPTQLLRQRACSCASAQDGQESTDSETDTQ